MKGRVTGGVTERSALPTEWACVTPVTPSLIPLVTLHLTLSLRHEVESAGGSGTAAGA